MANENKKITIVLDQKDTDLTFEQLGLQSDAEGKCTNTDAQIMDAVRGVVGEQIRDEDGQYTYVVRRSIVEGTGEERLYVYPKPGFGFA